MFGLRSTEYTSPEVTEDVKVSLAANVAVHCQSAGCTEYLSRYQTWVRRTLMPYMPQPECLISHLAADQHTDGRRLVKFTDSFRFRLLADPFDGSHRYLLPRSELMEYYIGNGPQKSQKYRLRAGGHRAGLLD